MLISGFSISLLVKMIPNQRPHVQGHIHRMWRRGWGRVRHAYTRGYRDIWCTIPTQSSRGRSSRSSCRSRPRGVDRARWGRNGRGWLGGELPRLRGASSRRSRGRSSRSIHVGRMQPRKHGMKGVRALKSRVQAQHRVQGRQRGQWRQILFKVLRVIIGHHHRHTSEIATIHTGKNDTELLPRRSSTRKCCTRTPWGEGTKGPRSRRRRSGPKSLL